MMQEPRSSAALRISGALIRPTIIQIYLGISNVNNNIYFPPTASSSFLKSSIVYWNLCHLETQYRHTHLLATTNALRCPHAWKGA